MSNLDLTPFIDLTGHIVLTFTNLGYFDYIHNMSINIKKKDIPWNLCVICSDMESYEKCILHGIAAIHINTNENNEENLKKMATWNDSNWNNVTFMKLKAMRQIMAVQSIKRITFIDGDIHIYRDFIPYLLKLEEENPEIEFFIQSDSTSNNPDKHSQYICSGFYHFKNSPRIHPLFDYNENDLLINTHNADQQHLTKKLIEYEIKTKQLSRHLFPNGSLFSNIPENPFLFHYNYMVGDEKRKNMMKMGHWYLSTEKVFHRPTDVVYPPFKNGLYLEEYFSKHNRIRDNRYIDVFWTNIQIDPKFGGFRNIVAKLVSENYPENLDKKYFTVVQHDDGVMFKLPANTRVYSAGGTGDIPIPLIYEDSERKLETVPKRQFSEKDIICSFVGSATHHVRSAMWNTLKESPNFHFSVDRWTNDVNKTQQDTFIDITVRSKFCLAPRGYGRTSFRFYEAFQLGSIPIYIWDDIEWLPYKDVIDYSKFCISIHVSKIGELENILLSIDEATYNKMWEEYEKIKGFFTLEGMTNYIHFRENSR